MTIHELSKYHKIKNEMKQLEDSIRELEETVIGSSKITGMPLSISGVNSSPTERIGIKLATLKQKLTDKTEQLLDEAQKIEEYIETVDDVDIRIIISKRFLDCKTWQQVANEIHADRSTPYYRLKKYLKDNLKEETNK